MILQLFKLLYLLQILTCIYILNRSFKPNQILVTYIKLFFRGVVKIYYNELVLFFKHHLDVRIGTFIQCPSFTCTCRMDCHIIILSLFHITMRTFRYSDFTKTFCTIFFSFFRKTEAKTSKYT